MPEYYSPERLSEALGFLQRIGGRAKLIVGGTNVIPDMRAKVSRPDVLIDIGHLTNLSYIKEERKKIRIGGLTTISEIASSKIIQNFAFIISQAANQLGNPLIRNRATIAGNLVDVSPAADTVVPLLVLDAMVMADRDGGKHREIPIDQFFLGPNQTVFKKDEQDEPL